MTCFLHEQHQPVQGEFFLWIEFLERARKAAEQKLDGGQHYEDEGKQYDAERQEGTRQAAELREQVDQLRQSGTTMANRIEALQKNQ